LWFEASQGKLFTRHYFKKKKQKTNLSQKRAGGVAQGVALSSHPSNKIIIIIIKPKQKEHMGLSLV
jgi:hypothetical protein